MFYLETLVFMKIVPTLKYWSLEASFYRENSLPFAVLPYGCGVLKCYGNTNSFGNFDPKCYAGLWGSNGFWVVGKPKP